MRIRQIAWVPRPAPGKGGDFQPVQDAQKQRPLNSVAATPITRKQTVPPQRARGQTVPVEFSESVAESVPIQPCRLTMGLIQIGAKGDVQPFETG
jgi:hypothetical protein